MTVYVCMCYVRVRVCVCVRACVRADVRIYNMYRTQYPIFREHA